MFFKNIAKIVVVLVFHSGWPLTKHPSTISIMLRSCTGLLVTFLPGYGKDCFFVAFQKGKCVQIMAVLCYSLKHVHATGACGFCKNELKSNALLWLRKMRRAQWFARVFLQEECYLLSVFWKYGAPLLFLVAWAMGTMACHPCEMGHESLWHAAIATMKNLDARRPTERVWDVGDCSGEFFTHHLAKSSCHFANFGAVIYKFYWFQLL